MSKNLDEIINLARAAATSFELSAENIEQFMASLKDYFYNREFYVYDHEFGWKGQKDQRYSALDVRRIDSGTIGKEYKDAYSISKDDIILRINYFDEKNLEYYMDIFLKGAPSFEFIPKKGVYIEQSNDFKAPYVHRHQTFFSLEKL
jgi:hypothetical protein